MSPGYDDVTKRNQLLHEHFSKTKSNKKLQKLYSSTSRGHELKAKGISTQTFFTCNINEVIKQTQKYLLAP